MLSLDPPTTEFASGAVSRLLALLAVGVFGAASLTATAIVSPEPVRSQAVSVAAPGAHRYAVAAAPRPVVRRQARHDVVTTVRPPVTHAAAKPARPAHRAVTRHRIRPFIPTGTGMWIYQWDHTSGGRAGDVVSRARRVGLSTLYLRTGSSHDGFTGAGPLGSLLRATRGTSVRVVAWDFPTLRHPVRDAHRLARAAHFHRGQPGPHVAAVAPDIETPAEGTFNAAWRVRQYLRVLNRHLPRGVTILTAVPWPSHYRLADYPYRTVARGSDVLVPMAYWYNNPPHLVTAKSIRYLRKFNKPVQPVGQGYDGKLDVPSLRHNKLWREVPVFFRTAHQRNVRAVSIWSWQSAPPATWRALQRAHRMFPAR